MNRHKSKQFRRVKLIFWMSALLVFPVSGCETLVPRRTIMMEREATGIKVSAAELRIRVQDLAIPFAGVIEEAADEIMAKSSDQNVRFHALLWKMNAIPALFTAIFRPDPAVAVIDVWAFTAQMIQYFGEGPGREALGEYHSIALDAARKLEVRILDLGRLVTDTADLSKPSALVHSWAAEHPIQSPLFRRESVVKEYADLIAESDLTAFAAVGKLSVGMDDLASWLAVYSEYLPNQARWQAELFLVESNAKGGINLKVSELAKLTDPLERVIPIVEKSPEIIARERTALLQALREERVAAFESINEQRVATLESINEQRVSTLDWLTEARIAIISSVRQERIDGMKDMEAIGTRIVGNGLLRSEQLIDHFFLRTAQLLAGALIVCFIAAMVAIRYIKKKNLK